MPTYYMTKKLRTRQGRATINGQAITRNGFVAAIKRYKLFLRNWGKSGNVIDRARARPIKMKYRVSIRKNKPPTYYMIQENVLLTFNEYIAATKRFNSL